MEMDVDQRPLMAVVKLSRIWRRTKRWLHKMEDPALVAAWLLLLLRFVTLPGAFDGISTFIAPHRSQLTDPQTWYAAMIQCLISSSISLGFLTLFSGYNPFKGNIIRDAVVVSLLDLAATFTVGVALFATLGHLALDSGRSVSDVMSGGQNLTFVSYPQPIAKFAFVPRCIVMSFVLMLFLLGMSSSVSLTGGLVTVFYHRFASWKRWLLTSLFSVVGFVAGLVYVTPRNLPILHVGDYSGGGFIILASAWIHLLAICCFSRRSQWADVCRFLHQPMSAE